MKAYNLLVRRREDKAQHREAPTLPLYDRGLGHCRPDRRLRRRRRNIESLGRALKRCGAIRPKTVLLHPIAQRVPRNSKPRRRARDVPFGLPQRGEELLWLYALHRVLHRDVRRHRRWQAEHPGGYLRLVGEQGDALDNVRELADVAGPRIGGKGRARFRRQRFWGQAVVGAGARHEMFRQEEDVVAAAFPQWRQRERQ